MELDTGARWKMFDRLFPAATVQLAHEDLPWGPHCRERPSTDEVCYEQQKLTLPLVVVEGNGPCLFGRQWLEKLRLNWQSINSVRSQTLESVLDRSELGTLKGYNKAQIIAQPRFCKARPVPYPMK